MTRVRIATIVLLASALGAAAFLPASSDASGQGRPWTHRITVVKGELTDHWTLVDSRPCQLTGGGTVTVSFHFVKPNKLVQLFMLPRTRWVVAIPGPYGGFVDMKPQPGAGTITFTDDRTQNPPDPDHGNCDPIEESRCGTFPLPRNIKVQISGYDRRYLKADLFPSFKPTRATCQTGYVDRFTDRHYTGGTPSGQLLLRMPSVRAVKQRPSITVTGTSHKRSVFADCEDGQICSEDVTRNVSVTFKHI